MRNINFQKLKEEHGEVKARQLFNMAFATSGLPGRPESYYNCRGGIVVEDEVVKDDIPAELPDEKAGPAKKVIVRKQN